MPKVHDRSYGAGLSADGTLLLHGEVPKNAKPNKAYAPDRRCVECGKPISRYNKHKTCWEHTPRELYANRGRRRTKDELAGGK